MIKVLVLQVNHKNDNENLRDLENAIASGHTDEEGWQMPGTAQAGDLVVWYETDGSGFMARGFVEAKPWRLPKGAPYGPFRGHVAAVQRIPPVDGRDVKDRTGVDGGHEGYQTVKDEKAVNFLRSVGLLSSDEEPTTLAGKHPLTRAETGSRDTQPRIGHVRRRAVVRGDRPACGHPEGRNGQAFGGGDQPSAQVTWTQRPVFSMSGDVRLLHPDVPCTPGEQAVGTVSSATS